MKRLILSLMAVCALIVTAAAAPTTVTPRAYGVQIFSSSDANNEFSTNSLVSFSVDSPNDITTEMKLSGMSIRGAACDGSTYYLVQSDDDLVSSSWWTLDMATRRLVKVADYPMGSLENSLLISDMTYDPTTNCIYALAFNLADAVVSEDDEVDAPFGLFKIEPATGVTTLVGYQEWVAFVTIAADAEGYLWGVDPEGALWEINKNNGRPIESYASSGMAASGLQSMCFDLDSNVLYWAGCDGWTATCSFGKFSFLEDMVAYEPIAIFENNNEIVGLYIDPNPVAANAPSEVEEFTAVPAANGLTEAVLSWVNPLTTNSGAELTGTLGVIIKRGGEEIARITDLAPGQKSTYTDRDVPAGLYDYSIIPYNQDGEGSPAYALDVYVGVDKPGAVENLSATKSADNYNITVTWDAPTRGEHNGWFDTSTLAYNIVRLPDNKVIAQNYATNSITDESISELEGYSYVVTPTTEYGDGPEAVSPVVVSGPALTLPQTFNFVTDEERRLWTSVPNSLGDVWEGYCFTSVDLWCMRYFPAEIIPSAEDAGWIVSPPMNLIEGNHYRLTFDLRTYGNLAPASVTVKYGYSSQPSQMTETLDQMHDFDADGMAFKTYNFDFVASGSGVAYFGIGIDNLVPAWLANVQVVQTYANDIAIERIEGSPVGNLDTASTFNVVIRNVGYEPVSKPAVKLVDPQGKVLAEGAYTRTLKPLDTATITLSWTPEQVGNTTLFAESMDDDNSANNTSTPYPFEVLEAGYWHLIKNGSYESAVAPTYLAYPYSYTQTLYLSDEIFSEEGTINGLMYYYYCYGHRAIQPFEVKVYLGNTTEDWLNVWHPFENSELTLVYEGTVNPDPYGSMMPIIFEDGFEYTGENLVIAVEQSNNSQNTDLRFYCGYGEEYDERTIYYRGDEPYSGKMTDTLQELANVSILMDTPVSGAGISDITLSKEVVSTRYYNISGVEFSAPTEGLFIRIDTLSDGSTRATKVIKSEK